MSSTPDTDAFEAVLRCPACAGVLARTLEGRACVDCAADYPDIGGLPCLLPDPSGALGEWRQRLHGLLTELAVEAGELRAALDRRGVPVAARERLKLQAAARDDHARRLKVLLAPFGVADAALAPAMHRALQTRVPGAAGLASYYTNLHRDWAWGTDENAKALGLVADALGPAAPRRVLVLGAGGGRLAYDLHQTLRPELTIAVDVNPLTTTVAQRLFDGGSVELYEFALAPRDLASHALLRRLAAPERAAPGLHAVLADATRAPFAAGAFDLVVTPWLIDVIDEDFAGFAPRVNAVLREGGHWVNSGPLAFSQADPAAHYTREEVLEIVAAAGFDGLRVSEESVPYMASPASRHARRETIVTFSAAKRRNVLPRAQPAAGPEWLTRTELPVPALPGFQQAALSMRIYGYLATLIDGERSIDDIARVVVGERLMMEADAAAAVRGFVRRLYAETRQGTL